MVVYASIQLLESNVVGVLAEALTTHVQMVLPKIFKRVYLNEIISSNVEPGAKYKLES